MQPLIADFMQLFDGYADAYGIYQLTGEVTDSGKAKGRAASKKGKMTTGLWQRHLSGEQGLGVIPINNDSKVKFGAIDIDEYPLDLVALNKNILDNDLPLVTVRTKSGGAHLYLFMQDWTPAKLVQKKLREFAAFLGYGSAEIFPKQTQILVDRGDIGQWINMPYFDAYKTMRYGLGRNHKSLCPEDFTTYAKDRTINQQTLESTMAQAAEILPGGPPCLQQILVKGFPEGTRNNGLFNLGVYAQKSTPDAWEKKLEELNNKHMDPPLSPNEVLGVIKSLKKKEYVYSCNTQPLSSHCNKIKCRGCKFGIGGGDLGMPVLGTLTKVLTSPPIWFLDVDGGGRIELTTDDLQSPIKFQNRCIEVLNVMPVVAKRENWQGIVQKLLEGVNIVEVPREHTPQGLLMQHLEEFCTSRVQANNAEEMLLGKPWLNGKYHYFRMKDFMKYLERQKFTEFKMNRIVVYLKDVGKAEHKFMNLRKIGTNVYRIPEFTTSTEGFETPKIQEDRPY